MNGTHVVLVDEHVKLSDRDAQVSLVELVGDIPADRSEGAALLDDGVEEAQTV